MDEDIIQMIKDCKTHERASKLSEWEFTFIDSISYHANAGHTLTPKQIERLETIWDRVTT